MRSPYVLRDVILEISMPWIPLARVAAPGPGVIALEEQPYPSSLLLSEDFPCADAWFLPVEALDGTWRHTPDLPDPIGWVVIDRSKPPFVVQSLGVCTADWFRRVTPRNTAWAPLPPWPRTAHDRLQAMKAFA